MKRPSVDRQTPSAPADLPSGLPRGQALQQQPTSAVQDTSVFSAIPGVTRVTEPQEVFLPQPVGVRPAVKPSSSRSRSRSRAPPVAVQTASGPIRPAFQAEPAVVETAGRSLASRPSSRSRSRMRKVQSGRKDTSGLTSEVAPATRGRVRDSSRTARFQETSPQPANRLVQALQQQQPFASQGWKFVSCSHCQQLGQQAQARL